MVNIVRKSSFQSKNNQLIIFHSKFPQIEKKQTHIMKPEKVQFTKIRITNHHQSTGGSDHISYRTSHISLNNQESKKIQNHHSLLHYGELQNKINNAKTPKASHRNFNKSLYGKLSKKIANKPVSFFQYGLTALQKKSCKPIFHEIFEVPNEKLNGTISVGELWDRKTSIKFLKENRMFYNKDLLLKQFEQMNKTRQRRKKNQSANKDKQIIDKYKRLLKFSNTRLTQVQQKTWNYHGITPQKACLHMRNQLSILAKGQPHKKKSSRVMMKKLQKNSDKMNEIKVNYENKMLLIL